MIRRALMLATLLLSATSAQSVSPEELAGRLYRDASDGNVQAVQADLQGGAPVNFQLPQTRSTALMTAAQNGRTDVVAFLLAHGANPDLRDWHGQTALDFARTTGNARLIALLQGASGQATPAPTAPAARPATLPTASRPAPVGTTWPGFGAFRPWDAVQFWTATGWRAGTITAVGAAGPRSSRGAAPTERQYRIAQDAHPDWTPDWYDWGLVAHLSRAPYWTAFFLGD
ncbi:hypothetical protein GCM10010844_37650 [Deinococcus radiotolerans]|uniref:Ankyrin repeat domain-containing protein n=2 Tax=Deinococcus radiotolerans TaxID=1309407 RepID=A0ABQ2FPW4_9DEIO|nr:hypothetical protein GCM10010844_37650 [Deinococcus radiotolerans]